ncbi:MAG: hypothetical protein J6L89_01170 [Clostridia bacterium]|nr:hypothetical protein [Clostridia bacterium]
MKIFILAVVIALLCMIVKNYKPEYALVCQLCGVAVLTTMLFSYFKDIVDSLSGMISLSGIDSSFLEILLKALGVSIVTDIASGVCRDSGNNTLSNAVELFGKTIIVFMALPMLKKLAEAAIGFIK